MKKNTGKYVYTKVNPAEAVDELLFGNNSVLFGLNKYKNSREGALDTKQTKQTRQTNQGKLSGRAERTGQGRLTGQTTNRTLCRDNSNDPLNLTIDEYDDMKKLALIITDGDRARMKQEEYELNQTAHQDAILRKTRMKELEKEAALHQTTIEEELEALTSSNPLVKKVFDAEDIQSDDMKSLRVKLNKMRYQKVLERQIFDKNEINENDKSRDQQWLDIMEKTRLDEIQKYRQYLEERKQKNDHEKEMISEQLAERELERIIEKEQIEAEGQLMVEKMRQDELEAARRQREKERKQRERAHELEEYNKTQKYYKLKKMEEEKMEDLAILDYQMMKNQREQKLMKEEEMKKFEKAKEIAKIQAMQKRMGDAQAAEDEKRAIEYQRWLEKKERRELEEKEMNRKNLLNDVLYQRSEQIKYKAMQTEIGKYEDSLEQERIRKENLNAARREKLMQDKKRAMEEEYKRLQYEQYLQSLNKKKLDRENQLKEDSMEDRMRQMKMLRERKIMEQAIREHNSRGYDLPPIRNGPQLTALQNVMNDRVSTT